MSSFRLREAAENDLFEIGLKSREKWGDEQVERYLTKLDHAFGLLAEMPNLGRACEFRPGWRRLHQGAHVIFYQVTPKGGVDIIRILHESQQHDFHLNDDDDD